MMRAETFDTFVKEQLNPAQQEAVLHTTGPVLVVAGAGSGKTRVITARITNLILNHHVSPQAIVALTFTNKAANEMKERIAHFLGNAHNLPFVGTFHAYCVRLLKQHSALLNLPTFTILDSDDQLKMVSGILHRANAHKNVTPRNAIYQISHVKNQLTRPISSHLFTHPFMEQVYIAYEKEKKMSNCLDFDDLMLEVLTLFRSSSLFKKMHQERVYHLLVDEYQDTNLIQHELLKHMALHNNTTVIGTQNKNNSDHNFAISSVCAVGDEDQSIYSWRGATIANMLNFKKDFTDTKIIKIEQNYRSVQPILEVANKVIEKNINRNPKKLWSDKKGIDRIRVVTCMSEYQEGESIAQCVKAAHSPEKPNSMAVLYRTHAQSRAIEEALIKHSIPYKIIGGIQFYERREIKDLFAYLRLIINPFDRTSFFRIINTPARGLGDKFEELFYASWNDEPFLTFTQIAQKLIDNGAVKNAKKVVLEQFITVFNGIDHATLPSTALEHIIKKIKYIEYLKDSSEVQEAQDRIDNVQELIDAVRYFETHNTNTIELLLYEVALMQEKMHKQNDNRNMVLLMSLHAAKGLEFDLVILAGLEENIMPTSRSLSNDDAVEEERRLFYVGITRAKERLLLTHTKYRYTYGKMVDQISSRFLDEIPAHLTYKQDIASFNPLQLNAFFGQWLGITNQASPVMTFGQSLPKQSSSSPYNQSNYNQSSHNSAPQKQLSPHKVNHSPLSHNQTLQKPYSTQSSTSTHTSFSPQSSRVYSRKQTTTTQTPSSFKTQPVASASTSSSLIDSKWRKNQPVKHATYGLGMVEKAEVKNGDTYITVTFKNGVKKIIARFLELI